MANPPQSFKRRDFLVDVESQIQDLWSSQRLYEAEPIDGKEKYYVTFPYPYMNGLLHIGHAFSLTKAEFQARYQRLKGRNVLFPFGYHATGTPIAACADKLKRELAWIEDRTTMAPQNEVDKETPLEEEFNKKTDITKFGGKKSKAVAKRGEGTQVEIMQKLGIPVEDIPKFADAHYWLDYFPQQCHKDLTKMGVAVDWRRSLITTDLNPYYDAFIKWQFINLKARGKISFGMRAAVFSQFDNQPCADHDRISGEGVLPQEYTAIKMQIQTLSDEWLHLVGDKRRVYFVAATLRPETMYGQTNCFVLPEGKYGLFLAFTTAMKRFDSEKEAEECSGALHFIMTREEALKRCDCVFICSRKSALNMAYQGILPLEEEPMTKGMAASRAVLPLPHCLLTVTGQQLIGMPLSAPNALYPTVYALPMLSISMDKGTGIVTSVPSDAPDDFVALRDLQQKEKLREKYGVKKEWTDFDIVEIIDIPGLGTKAAVDLCIAKKIASQNDARKLTEVKDEVYKKGFYEGVLIVGKYTGTKVCDAKTLVRDDLIGKSDAFLYSEPENKVMARCGFECIVALCNQWYIDYGEETWKKAVAEHVTGPHFNAFSTQTLNQLRNVIVWLGPWACSRNYGLGSLLPWEEEKGRRVLIESLSDSTIYMSYYTIAHLLHADIRGSVEGPLHIKPCQLTNAVFDYIFAQTDEIPIGSTIPVDTLQRLKKEFLYWYPTNLRVSGKDLIFNHLTMSLFVHTAMWPTQPELWPRGYFCNGHILVNGEKMSKSVGNFITLNQALRDYSSDATRLSLADAGDTLDDANFQTETANSAIMRLFLLHQFVEEFLSEKGSMRKGQKSSADLLFDNTLQGLAQKTETAYEKGAFREALKHGFYDYSLARDFYRHMCGGTWTSMHEESVLFFIETQIKILCPLTPHICEWIWTKMLGKQTFVVNESWPIWSSRFDTVLQRKKDVLEDSVDAFRKTRDKAQHIKGGKKKDADKKAKPSEEMTNMKNCAIVYVAKTYKSWQQVLLKELQKIPLNDIGDAPLDSSYMVKIKDLPEVQSLEKNLIKDVLSFASYQMKHEVALRGPSALELTMPFDETDLFMEHLEFLRRNLELDELYVQDAEYPLPTDNTACSSHALPSRPTIFFYSLSLTT